MSHSFSLDGQPVPFRIRVSTRARRMALRFSEDGLEVVAPPRLRDLSPHFLFQRFEGWIRRQLKRHRALRERRSALAGQRLLRGVEIPHDASLTRAFFFEEARRDLEACLTARSAEMEQPFRRMVVREQKTLWGSCSPRTGTLSFNVKLVMAPPAVLDYIVVHELAHFKWRGHGVRFWERVARFCPDYKARRRWLRENGWRLALPAADDVPPHLVQ